MGSDRIVVKGARTHNLKGIDVEIPRDRMVVITGLSGSGKSSLAFDTIYAEGQRRYIESLSAYARQFLGQMEKPDCESIDGLSPAIAIQQRSGSKNPRSTVATVTETYDYLRLLYARIGVPHCPRCGGKIERASIDKIVDRVLEFGESARLQILSPLVRGMKGEHRDILEEAKKQGFVRARVDGIVTELSSMPRLDKKKKHDILIVVDRVVVKGGVRKRLADSLEQALKMGKGLALVNRDEKEDVAFSERMSCPKCGISVPELEPRMFSFNSPFGACLECSGLGTKVRSDPELMFDLAKSPREGGIKPWGQLTDWWGKANAAAYSAHFKFSLDTPVGKLPRKVLDAILHGTKGEKIKFKYEGTGDDKWSYQREKETLGLLKWFEDYYPRTHSDQGREWAMGFMREMTCGACKGRRLKPEALGVKVGGRSVDELTRMSVRDASRFFRSLKLPAREAEIARQVLKEILARLSFLEDVGLDYLTLDRQAGSLSGGEAQRIHLATQIGSQLVGVLYILDEPSIGLHSRDNQRLLSTLTRLRDIGNTVLVVEHDAETIRAADWLVDLGPGAGVEGGRVVFSGPPGGIGRAKESLTGAYLDGRMRIEVPGFRVKTDGKWLVVKGAAENNLRDIDVRIPLGTLTCITGVSGSGKSTLVDEILHKALAKHFYQSKDRPGKHKRIEGVENVDKVIIIDQSPIGRTPRSNPATYIGVLGDVRDLFAATEEARARGYKPGRFSFNVKGGRCEACEGHGYNELKMHFLPDVYVPCELCGGDRFNRETLEVRYKGKSIADVLRMSVSEALRFFENIPTVKRQLQVIDDVGLGYIALGQSATTLSGGEAQRVKLATELIKRATGRTLYILDEPTTGLHFHDVKALMSVLLRLRDAGNTLLIIEHNLEVIKCADWIVDLGPEGGDEGGRIVAEGTPEDVARAKGSHTGEFLQRLVRASRSQAS
jgi:excinuclease ABC subunit A